MPQYPSEWIDQVRDASSIVEIVGTYVPLKQNGRRHWGRCPFHSEKTASFSVDAEKQLFYCFGCHKGGTVFHFVMEMEHLEFPEALVYLAEKAHIPVPDPAAGRGERGGRASSAERERIFEALTAAARLYHQNLYAESGSRALSYLRGRGLGDAAIRRFGLGASEPGYGALSGALRAMGFDDGTLQKAGLLVAREGRSYDMFRDRAMFPIFDPRGRVIAFGGRVLGDGSPKYLNSSDTPVFNKRKNLYALNFLKGRAQQELLLCEGYMDVIMLGHYGIPGCVATLGTALTPEQARLMGRYAKTAVVVYDGDEAGQRATMKALDVLEQVGLRAQAMVIPGGLDPDEYVRKFGKEGFLALPRQEAMAYRLGVEKARHDLSAEEGKTEYARAAADLLRPLRDPVLTERYVRQVAAATGYPADVLYAQIGINPPKSALTGNSAQRIRHNTVEREPDHLAAQKQLVALLAGEGSVPAGLIRAEDFDDPLCRRLAEALIEQGGKTAAARLADGAESAEDAARIAEILQMDPHCPPEKIPRIIEDAQRRIEIYRIDAEAQSLTEALKDAAPGDRAPIVGRLGQLSQRLGRIKSGRKE